MAKNNKKVFHEMAPSTPTVSARPVEPGKKYHSMHFQGSAIAAGTETETAIPGALRYVSTEHKVRFFAPVFGFEYVKDKCLRPYAFSTYSSRSQETKGYTRYTVYGPYSTERHQALRSDTRVLQSMAASSDATDGLPFMRCDFVFDTKRSGVDAQRFQLSALGALMLFAADGMDVGQRRTAATLSTDMHLIDGFTHPRVPTTQGRSYLPPGHLRPSSQAVVMFDTAPTDFVSFTAGLIPADADPKAVVERMSFDEFPDSIQHPVLASMPTPLDKQVMEGVAALVARASFVCDEWQ